jgi:hypothetical protein
VLAAGAVLALLALYGYLRRWAAVAAAVLALGALAGGAAALAGFRAYGPTADPRAVVVWSSGTLRSIPTEADVAQKTTTLAAGSTAVADKEFLDWIRIRFPGGQTGWIPKAAAVYLWKFPPPGKSG